MADDAREAPQIGCDAHRVEQAIGAGRDHRADRDGEHRDRDIERGEHRLHPLGIGFLQLPGGLLVDIGIAREHGLDPCLGRLAEGEIVVSLGDGGFDGFADHIEQGVIGVIMAVDFGEAAAEVLEDLRQGALGEIAETVGEIGIGPCYNGFCREAAIVSEADVAQQEIAQRIDAEAIGKLDGIDNVAGRFRHFLAAVEDESVAESLHRQLDVGGHQEGGPVNRVEADDILPD